MQHIQLTVMVASHEWSQSSAAASEPVLCLFCLFSVCLFVAACLFVVRLKSICPYQCSGWEEITEQKQ